MIRCCVNNTAKCMQDPNGTEQGVRWSKPPMSSRLARHKCSMETSLNLVRVKIGNYVMV